MTREFLNEIDQPARGPTCWYQHADGAGVAGRLRHHAPISTALLDVLVTPKASAAVGASDSTRTPPGCCWLAKNPVSRFGAAKPSVAFGAEDHWAMVVGRAKPRRQDSRTFLDKEEPRTTASCASPATARRGRATPNLYAVVDTADRELAWIAPSRSVLAPTSFCWRKRPISIIPSSGDRRISHKEELPADGCGPIADPHASAWRRTIVVPHPTRPGHHRREPRRCRRIMLGNRGIARSDANRFDRSSTLRGMRPVSPMRARAPILVT